MGIREYIKANIITISLVLTLIIAVILRFKGLTFQSYWADELWSAVTSNPDRSFWSMYDITVKDVHPPLYQSILWILYHIFGFNEFTGRVLSAMIGTLSVFAIFLLGKEFFNKEIGLYAAIIASMNHFLIYYSQETRSYNLLFLLSIMSYVYLMKVLTNYSKRNFILYLLFTIALVYTHYFGFFLVATQVFVFVYYFVKEKTQRKHLVILAFITAATIVISLLPLMEYITSNAEMKNFWIGKPSEWFVIDYMKAYTKSQYLDGIFLVFSTMSLGYLFIKKEKIYKNVIIVLIIWIVIGYLLPYIRSITATPLLTSRNTIIVIPALILLIAYGVYLLKDSILKISVLVVIVFFSWYQINISKYYHKVTKQQWREVLFSIKDAGSILPIYEPDISYSVYSSMLNLDLKTQLVSNIDEKIKNNSLENCFLVVVAHVNHIKDIKVLNNKDIKKVLEIKKHGAKGVLYAHNTSPQKCSMLYNGILEDIDFTECNLSKPYKGNPLNMLWSGSVTTAVYALLKDSYILSINAKGTKAFDEYAKIKLQVLELEKNKKVLMAEKIITAQPKYAEYVLPFTLNTDSNISFVVSFINDKGRKEPKEDRNAYIKSIKIRKVR